MDQLQVTQNRKHPSLRVLTYMRAGVKRRRSVTGRLLCRTHLQVEVGFLDNETEHARSNSLTAPTSICGHGSRQSLTSPVTKENCLSLLNVVLRHSKKRRYT